MAAIHRHAERPGAGTGQGRTRHRLMRRLALAHLHLVVAEMFVSSCAISHEPQLVTVPQPGLRPVASLDQVFDYRTAAATVAWIFEHDFGFPSFPATFRFYPNREAFEQALLEVGYDQDLARSAAKTMTAVGGHRGVLLNNAMLGSLPWANRVALLAHEFGHSLQYSLAAGGAARPTSGCAKGSRTGCRFEYSSSSRS